MQDSGHRTLNSGLSMLDARLWTLDPRCWTLDAGFWTLDFRLWTLNAGRWALDTGLWALDTVIDCCITESELSFGIFLLTLLKVLSMQISKDHGHTCSVETIGSNMAVFRYSMLKIIFIIRN